MAPVVPAQTDSFTAGPRVAPPDHERTWETALRAPFRVVFFPLKLVGMGVEQAAGRFGTPLFVPKPPREVPHFSVRPYVNASGLRDVGIGPSLTYFGGYGTKVRLRGSWSAIHRVRGRFSYIVGEEHLVGFRVRADYDSKPNRRFYGIGNDAAVEDKSYVLLETVNSDAALLLGRSPFRQLRLIGGYTRMGAREGTYGTPLLGDVFTPAQAPFMRVTTEALTYGVSADLAGLDDTRDPSFGAHYRGEWRHAVGMRDIDPSYEQWLLEGRAYVPVFAKRRVLVFRGVYTGIEPVGGSTVLPFYRLPTSDGYFRFAGFAGERFRDRQLIIGRAEYRWAVLYRLQALGFYELGEVAPRSASFTWRDAHESLGGGLRFAFHDDSVVRAELANSVEGYRAVLMIGGDF